MAAGNFTAARLVGFFARSRKIFNVCKAEPDQGRGTAAAAGRGGGSWPRQTCLAAAAQVRSGVADGRFRASAALLLLVPGAGGCPRNHPYIGAYDSRHRNRADYPMTHQHSDLSPS